MSDQITAKKVPFFVQYWNDTIRPLRQMKKRQVRFVMKVFGCFFLEI